MSELKNTTSCSHWLIDCWTLDTLLTQDTTRELHHQYVNYEFIFVCL